MKNAAPWIEAAERVARTVAAHGWAPGTGGNLSVNLGGPQEPKGVPDCLELGAAVPRLAGRSFLVTRSGCRFRNLDGTADLGFVRPLPQGDRAELWFAGDSVPTFELDVHMALHAALDFTDSPARAILHVHPPHLVALTHLEDHRSTEALEHALLGAHPEVAYQIRGGLGYLPYVRSGATGLARQSAELAARGASVLVWGFHGCVTMAEDLDGCVDLAELVESAARIRLAALATGHDSHGMTRDQIRAMQKLREQTSLWEEGKEL